MDWTDLPGGGGKHLFANFQGQKPDFKRLYMRNARAAPFPSLSCEIPRNATLSVSNKTTPWFRELDIRGRLHANPPRLHFFSKKNRTKSQSQMSIYTSKDFSPMSPSFLWRNWFWTRHQKMHVAGIVWKMYIRRRIWPYQLAISRFWRGRQPKPSWGTRKKLKPTAVPSTSPGSTPCGAVLTSATLHELLNWRPRANGLSSGPISTNMSANWQSLTSLKGMPYAPFERGVFFLQKIKDKNIVLIVHSDPCLKILLLCSFF